MKDIGEKIKIFRKKKGLKQKDLAKILGLTPQAISGWERGTSFPQVELYAKISEILGVSKNNLFFDGSNKGNKAINAVCNVPFYSQVEAAAGEGMLGDDYPAIDTYPLPEMIVGKQFNREAIFCIRCCGDSMEPIINGGSILAVNGSMTDICDGDIYLLNMHGLLRVKCLYLEATGIVIKSYNDNYADEKVSFEYAEANQLKILGKVIWYSTSLISND